MSRLIVNADDFGLTSGVNRAILELHQAGVLTSATLMARASATAEAIEIARSTPTLGVGCHVVLVDGEPTLSATRDIPSLADPTRNRFEASLIPFLATIYRQSSVQKIAFQIEKETSAQIASLQRQGLRLTHIDTHKHTHMFPRVLTPILRAARAAGIRAVRNPFEPTWSLHATRSAPLMRRTEVKLLRLLESRFKRIVTEQGLSTSDGALGVLATGTLDQATITSLLKKIPEGDWELVTHPGYNDADLAKAGTRLMASRNTERQALEALRNFPSVGLISFADLQAPSPVASGA
ncbi:MAG TPA: ChbG/HpnK family deacetylase [Terracidiphilus sp.]